MNALFARYPELRKQLPWLSLAQLPTPLAKLPDLGMAGGTGELLVKRDDLTSPVYGGNKVRKLSFLLAAVLESGAKTVITFGAAGSNHALATAMLSAPLGLQCVSILGPQHNARSVRRNLLAAYRAGATLAPCAWRDTATETRRHFWAAADRDGVLPAVIPPGGSSPLGAVGFVDAALELAGQWEALDEPPPDAVYVASGTMGTCAGLALGFAAAGLPTRVEAVRVTVAPYTSDTHARALFQACNRLLHARDAAFPLLPFPEDRFRIRDDFFGAEYALYTPESAAAVRHARDRFGLKLEGTYTGKAFAALLHDAASGALSGRRAVFWNTHNSREPAPVMEEVDYRALPEPLHHYFETPVQPLDR